MSLTAIAFNCTLKSYKKRVNATQMMVRNAVHLAKLLQQKTYPGKS